LIPKLLSSGILFLEHLNLFLLIAIDNGRDFSSPSRGESLMSNFVYMYSLWVLVLPQDPGERQQEEELGCPARWCDRSPDDSRSYACADNESPSVRIPLLRNRALERPPLVELEDHQKNAIPGTGS
jgi:hypothetical protein